MPARVICCPTSPYLICPVHSSCCPCSFHFKLYCELYPSRGGNPGQFTDSGNQLLVSLHLLTDLISLYSHKKTEAKSSITADAPFSHRRIRLHCDPDDEYDIAPSVGTGNHYFRPMINGLESARLWF